MTDSRTDVHINAVVYKSRGTRVEIAQSGEKDWRKRQVWQKPRMTKRDEQTVQTQSVKTRGKLGEKSDKRIKKYLTWQMTNEMETSC